MLLLLLAAKHPHPRGLQCFYGMSSSQEVIMGSMRDLHLFPILPCTQESQCPLSILFWLITKPKGWISALWSFHHSHWGFYWQHLMHPLKCFQLLSSGRSDFEPDNGIPLSQSYGLKYLVGSKFHYFNLPLTITWTLAIHCGFSTKLNCLAVACTKPFYNILEESGAF